MACRSCKAGLDFLSRRPLTLSAARRLHGDHAVRLAEPAVALNIPPRQSRSFHRTTPQRSEKPSVVQILVDPLVKGYDKVRSKTTGTYALYGTTEMLFKQCSSHADYTISAEDRAAGKVTQLEDGEEIGKGSGVWHDDFHLIPTFSTWAQVTMLHMYLMIVRLRCMPREQYDSWQRMFVDHFFVTAEQKMDIVHGMYSRSMRQRYLKDLFLQWRGAVMAYDEGMVKGDAVLASAVWRNVFQASEDIDVQALAAIVSWMRSTLKALGDMEDDELVMYAQSVMKKQPTLGSGLADDAAEAEATDAALPVEENGKVPDTRELQRKLLEMLK